MPERLSVSQLNRYVKLKLETDDALRNVWLEGEISNWVVNGASGHAYFTLKDAAASVRAVMFKTATARLRFVVKNGMQVLAGANVSLFERDGQFQLIVNDLLPLGDGAQQASLEQLKEKLGAEGLFAPEKKRALPAFPKTIAVVTSASGAALQDIVNVLRRRYPAVELEHYHASVQGLLAEPQITAALKAIAVNSKADVVIVARGGGSKEDLWVFNSESIVRAAAALPMPFISAVGHETDYTLLDFASDMRAPTPSAAAELAVPDARELIELFVSYRDYMQEQMSRQLTRTQTELASVSDLIFEQMDDRLKAIRLRLENVSKTASINLQNRFLENERRLIKACALIDSLSPFKVLARGYTAVKKGGKYIASISALKRGDAIDVDFSDGSARCNIETIKKGEFPFVKENEL